MRINDPEAKDKLIQRLRRIEGQLRGVQGMVNDERDCQEILQQLAAIRSAVQGASRVFLKEYATKCLLDLETETNGDAGQQHDRREKLLQDMIELLSKVP